MPWQETISEWLKANDRSQAWLARRADLSEQHFSRLMTGKIGNPAEETLRKLEEAMGMAEGTLEREPDKATA